MTSAQESINAARREACSASARAKEYDDLADEIQYHLKNIERLEAVIREKIQGLAEREKTT